MELSMVYLHFDFQVISSEDHQSFLFDEAIASEANQ